MAVSEFVVCYVATHRVYAPSTLQFKSDYHQRWCEAILEATKPNSGVRNPYHRFIAKNTDFKDYVDYMWEQSMQDW